VLAIKRKGADLRRRDPVFALGSAERSKAQDERFFKVVKGLTKNLKVEQ
jgi:hypothetical protein